MGVLLSVNVAHPLIAAYSDDGVTGIDKRPVTGPVTVSAPGPLGAKATSGSGVAGDRVYYREHGGDDQAVYAYAREDLDVWAAELERDLPDGVFGENMTTTGLDVSGALIGERWRIGSRVVLEVTSPRIPCRTFGGWMDVRYWVKRFTVAARPGAYFRVVTPGPIEAGDSIEVVSRPRHGVSVALLFRALTRERELLPQVAPALDAMNQLLAEEVRGRLAAQLLARVVRGEYSREVPALPRTTRAERQWVRGIPALATSPPGSRVGPGQKVAVATTFPSGASRRAPVSWSPDHRAGLPQAP